MYCSKYQKCPCLIVKIWLLALITIWINICTGSEIIGGFLGQVTKKKYLGWWIWVYFYVIYNEILRHFHKKNVLFSLVLSKNAYLKNKFNLSTNNDVITFRDMMSSSVFLMATFFKWNQWVIFMYFLFFIIIIYNQFHEKKIYFSCGF